jgi:hypothetical protein
MSLLCSTDTFSGVLSLTPSAGPECSIVSSKYRLFAFAALALMCLIAAPAAQPQGFYAIVERNGAVVLCVSNNEILFPDRCTGTGRLLIVQPIEEGEVAWVSATGVVAMENKSPQNPDCALSRAKWDPKAERKTSTGRELRKIQPAAVVQKLNKSYQSDLVPSDVSSIGIDLDNDGREDIVYAADSVPRVAALNEKTGQAYPYFVQGGIFRGQTPDHPQPFFFDTGEYEGGTDAIGRVALKGIVPLSAAAGGFAILAEAGGGLDGDQHLVWLGGGRLQRFVSFEFRCH